MYRYNFASQHGDFVGGINERLQIQNYESSKLKYSEQLNILISRIMSLEVCKKLLWDSIQSWGLISTTLSFVMGMIDGAIKPIDGRR